MTGTASLATASVSLEQDVDAERTRTLTVRLRLLLWVSLGMVLMVIIGSPVAPTGLSAPYFALRLTSLLVVVSFLVASYRPGFVRHQLFSGLVLATGIAMLSARGGVLRDDITVTATLHLILSLFTAAILPWGVACQAAVVFACGASMTAAAYVMGLSRLGEVDVLVLINLLSGCLLSLLVAYESRGAFDRGARENLRLRALEEYNRALNEGLEATVRARTAELRTRTTELEDTVADQRAVTRAISHDLRQPLRHIAGYVRMVEDDLGSSLGEGNLARFDRVRAATVRMGRMVDALAELSRVSGRPVERDDVDMSGFAVELCDDLARAEPERAVSFTIEAGLTERCDAALTRDLLRELLGNAWKFTREQPAARIEFGRRGQAWCVRDNGPGFDMSHTQRLFHVFERLHHVTDFEGEGVGLAIAERIVRSHGGRIWAESEPSRGATFLFTLHGDN